MRRIGTRQAGVFAFCAAIPALAPDCAGSVTVVDHFELPTCPQEPFSLPQSVERGPYELSLEAPPPTTSGLGYGQCVGRRIQGDKFYHLVEHRKERFYYHVRMSRGPACHLEVGYW